MKLKMKGGKAGDNASDIVIFIVFVLAIGLNIWFWLG